MKRKLFVYSAYFWKYGPNHSTINVPTGGVIAADNKQEIRDYVKRELEPDYPISDGWGMGSLEMQECTDFVLSWAREVIAEEARENALEMIQDILGEKVK